MTPNRATRVKADRAMLSAMLQSGKMPSRWRSPVMYAMPPRAARAVDLRFVDRERICRSSDLWPAPSNPASPTISPAADRQRDVVQRRRLKCGDLQ